MTVLLKTNADKLYQLSTGYKIVYSIVLSCEIFANSDIQLRTNESVLGKVIVTSIFECLISQTISGLVYRKSILGKVAFLEGSLHFLDEL
jgi:activator of 2-hydroxyglutaryl-CoA dehydratase